MEWIEAVVERIVALPTWAAWLAIVAATFVSEDLTCVAAGLAAATGRIGAFDAIGAAALGIWLGDLGLYVLGRLVGRPALARAPLRWFLREEDLLASRAWFVERGARVLLLTRFVPGTRLPTYVAAGMLDIGLGRFAAYTLAAVLAWAPLIGGGAMLLGRGVLPWIERYNRLAIPALLAAALAYLLAFKLLVPAFTWRGRRMIVSRWRRATRWEFWPPWLFYPPVLAYVGWLALRHRSLSVLTAVNPGVPAGGFIDESKSDILAGLSRAEGLVAGGARIGANESREPRRARVDAFLAEERLGFPIVLKPDAGQRGSGVAIVRDREAAARYLERIRVDCIVQEYASGDEFGVFYFRDPAEPDGRIFSITRKVFPTVRGDGVRTLDELILGDPRAVCMAKLHLARNAASLSRVPAEGEIVQIVEIGNHCQGAVFLDGRDLITPELEAAIDRLSKAFDGFYFGRYDLRARSAEHLRRGEGFKVIELNGATSEATHIYDPEHGLLHAYSVLFRQWRILFDIAAENRRRGAPTVGVGELLRAVMRYRAAARSHPA
jgi:membrane protein DedA with SNARE-associated domain